MVIKFFASKIMATLLGTLLLVSCSEIEVDVKSVVNDKEIGRAMISDADGDGLADAADPDFTPGLPDSDFDGIPDISDSDHPSNPGASDGDGDGIIDEYDAAHPPVAYAITPANLQEDVESLIKLSYTDAEKDKASSCALSNLSNVKIGTPCFCDASGDCFVGVAGNLNVFGAAQFDYTVSANGDTSNVASASFTISPVNDAPSISQACLAYGSGSYSCSLSAVDVDSASFNWTLVSDTCGYFSLDSNTGVLSANIPGSPSASCDVTVKVSDGSASSADTLISLSKIARVDSDGDGLADGADLNQNPGLPDADGDGIADVGDADHPSNGGASDSDGDGIIDNYDMSHAPLATNINPSGFDEDVESLITLSYSDLDSDLATSCNVSSLGNISVSTACSCDIAGVCVVGVKGLADFHGAGSFDFTVTANGEVSNSASASFTINPVNDAPSITQSCGDFYESSAYTCSPSAVDVDSSVFTWSEVADTCGYFSIDSNTGVITGAIPAGPSVTCDYTIRVSDGALTSSDVVITLNKGVPITCPSGYIPVPANASLGVAQFCVMKFEAKNKLMQGASSLALGKPWVSINGDNALAECEKVTDAILPGSFHLISNAEWMTIARDIESVASNWSSNVAGSGLLPVGHTDNDPALTLPVSDVNDPYTGTLDNASESLGQGREQKRTLNLSNGEVIWDFSGNVSEWVDWDASSVGFTLGPQDEDDSSWKYLSEASTGSLVASEYQPSGDYGMFDILIGRWIGGVGGAATRGGDYGLGITYSGVYQLDLRNAATDVSGTKGFRCVYRP